MRREYAKVAGWAALILLLGTGVSYSVRSMADASFWIPLGLGLASAAFWLLEFRSEALHLLRSRSARQGANSVVYTLAVLAIVVLLQALLVNNNASIDLTKDKAFTLADETVKTVKALDHKVQILAFYAPEQRGAFEDLLKRVRQVNPAQFDYEFVNINKEPLKAKQYGVRSLGTSVAVAGDKSESFNGSSEEELLNAVIKVGNGSTKQVYFLQGHQERSLDDAQAGGASELKKGLESSSFAARSLNLALSAKAAVPEDCAALVIAGPQHDLLAPELDALSAYMARGGRVIVALDPRVPAPGLKAWVAKGGVKLDEDIAIDVNPFNQIFGGSPVAPIIQDFDGNHPVTKDLRQQQGQAIFPQTRSLSLAGLPEGATGTILARSLPSAFGWTGSGSEAPTKPGAQDVKGPLNLMAAVELPLKVYGGPADAPADQKARLIVLGTSQFMANKFVVAFNDQDLAVNSVRWLSGEEKRIALAPKPKENDPLLLDRGRLSLVWWSFILMALGAAATGLGVWVLRRRQTA